MKNNSYIKYSILILLFMFLTRCSHHHLLYDLDNWPDKTIKYKNLTVELPNNFPWYVLEYSPDDQRIVFALPKLNTNKSEKLTHKETGKKVLILENSSSNLDTYVYSTIDLYCNRIDEEHDSLSNTDYLNAYIEEDLQWSMRSGLLPSGVEYGDATFDIAPDRAFLGYATKEGSKPFNQQIAIFSIFNFENARFLIAAKLFTTKESDEDVYYLENILQNTKVHN